MKKYTYLLESFFLASIPTKKETTSLTISTSNFNDHIMIFQGIKSEFLQLLWFKLNKLYYAKIIFIFSKNVTIHCSNCDQPNSLLITPRN